MISKLLSLVFIWQATHFLTDCVIESFLKLLKQIAQIINSLLQIDNLQEIIDAIPQTLYKARKIANIDRDNFEKHVVCHKCDSVYNYDKCFILVNGKNFLREFLYLKTAEETKLLFPLTTVEQTGAGSKFRIPDDRVPTCNFPKNKKLTPTTHIWC